MRVTMVLEDAERAPIERALAQRGHAVTVAPAAVLDTEPLARELVHAELIIADAGLAIRVGLLQHLAAAAPGVEVILVGHEPAQANAAEVLAHVARPIDLTRLLGYAEELAEIVEGQRQREPVDLVSYDTLFAGDSPQLANLVRRVRLVARSDAPTWILGDDGSGRAIVARAIHDRSSRRSAPFVAFNTAAYSDDELARLLLEGDELRTAGGTLFLDQIATAGPSAQRAVVQLLERRRDGGARIIVGAQASDASQSAQRMLAQELYFQLKVLEVEVPRLKDRARDIEAIVTRMIQRLAGDATAPALTSDALRVLTRYSFPGNLLELAHALTHAFVVAHGRPIEPHHLPPSLRQPVERAGDNGDLQSLDTVARRFERDYLLRVLRSTDGNRGRAAEILGLSRKGLWGKLKSHGISNDDIGDEAEWSDSSEAAKR